jgi:hypothetical protein
VGPWDGPVLVCYDSEYCDADNAEECSLVSLSCADQFGRGLRISVDGLELEQVIRWMTAEAKTPTGMQLSISGVKPEGRPTLARLP